MNKFNKPNDRNQFCIDYGSKLATVNGPSKNAVQKPAEQVVRNIPIKIEPKEPEKSEEEEIVELEAEEEEVEESSSQSESEEESEEGELPGLVCITSDN